jgi:hypothetical protein
MPTLAPPTRFIIVLEASKNVEPKSMLALVEFK